jgi:uncharacterized protein
MQQLPRSGFVWHELMTRDPGASEQFYRGPEGHWISYIGTDDVDAAARTAQRLGGQVLLAPTDVPGVGRAAVLRDPDGAAFGVFAPAPAP